MQHYAIGSIIGCTFCMSCAHEIPVCYPDPKTAPQIEAAYVDEIVAACQGYTVETCPKADGIKTKYRPQREAAVICK